MEYQYVRMQRDGDTATLVLDPPDHLLDLEAMEEINAALLSLRGDTAVEVLVLRGSNGQFCRGLNLQEHVKERVQRLLQVYSRIFETIRMLDVVSVAAVEGRAWGSGFELALGCNLIVAADDASFCLPEIQWGIFPPIAAIILPRVVPRRRAMEWILTGNEIPAQDLERFGLLNRVYPTNEFDERLEGFITEITQKSGPVLQLAKRAQYEAYYSTYEEALYKVQNLYLRELLELSDAEQGIRAALEGREPEWKNR